MLDASGASILLSNFWREQPALILFWRQFGCGCGMDRAERLKKEYSRLSPIAANAHRWAVPCITLIMPKGITKDILVSTI
jgi:hypothetical protein